MEEAAGSWRLAAVSHEELGSPLFEIAVNLLHGSSPTVVFPDGVGKPSRSPVMAEPNRHAMKVACLKIRRLSKLEKLRLLRWTWETVTQRWQAVLMRLVCREALQPLR